MQYELKFITYMEKLISKNDVWRLFMNNGDNIDGILQIYKIYSDDNQKYMSIIWQFPAAIISINIISINYFLNKPQILFFISLANFVLLHSLFKQAHHQKVIINALKKIEVSLREHYDKNMIPDFEAQNRILKIKSVDLLSYTLLAMNIIFLLYILCSLRSILFS